MLRFKTRAQSTAEYAIVIALVVGAVVAMQVYVRRGLQGRMRDAVSNLATKTATLGAQEQYEPTEVERDMKQVRDSKIREEEEKDGTVSRSIVGVEQTKVEGDLAGFAYEKYNYTETKVP